MFQFKPKYIIRMAFLLQLDVDFQKLGLGNPSEGSKKWDTLLDQLTVYISKNARDPSAKEFIKSLKIKQSSTGKTFVAEGFEH